MIIFLFNNRSVVCSCAEFCVEQEQCICIISGHFQLVNDGFCCCFFFYLFFYVPVEELH